MKRFNRRKSQYARRISDIITKEKSNSNRTITLSKIQKIYTEKFKTNISLTTISRVLRNHLDLHFKRTKIKNPKLNKLNYKFMEFLFLKCVVRAINNNLNIIFIDETACYLQNNNFRNWIGKEEKILKGAEKGLKEKFNVVMAINKEKIIHYKIYNENVNSELFKNFIEELSTKLTQEQIKNSLVIFDNASCHKTKEVIEECLNKKFKIITNIPYKSEFNGIEFLFGYLKNQYYKYIFASKNEQKNKIIEIIESKEMNDNLESFYLQAYEKYLNTIREKNEKENLIDIYDKIININEDDLSKDFEE